eukprot:4594396-Pyramimonas_sp.AAC.1
MDLLAGFDLLSESGERALWKVLEGEAPEFVMMSPLCKAFSQARRAVWHHMDEGKRDEEEEKGIRAFLLCARVAEYQVQRGRFFMIEHPLTSLAWETKAAD